MTEIKTHWKKLTNPDYIGAYSLEPGKDMILTMKKITRETVTGAEGKKEECTVIRFAENVKPMIVNNTNAKTIAKIYKTPYIEDWEGRKIQIYSAEVKAFGEVVDALRVRPFVPVVQAESICADCGKPIDAYQGVTGEQLAKATYQKYGKALCYSCSTIERQKVHGESNPLGGGKNEQISIGD